jgi:hypothetical protein
VVQCSVSPATHELDIHNEGWIDTSASELSDSIAADTVLDRGALMSAKTAGAAGAAGGSIGSIGAVVLIDCIGSIGLVTSIVRIAFSWVKLARGGE